MVAEKRKSLVESMCEVNEPEEREFYEVDSRKVIGNKKLVEIMCPTEVERQRESSGFLIKQRAFLKVYLLTEIERGQAYGLQLLDILQKKFKPFGFEPNHAEVYRCLHDLTEEGYLSVRNELAEGAKRKMLQVYSIKDKDKVNAYKKLAKADLDRCQDLLRLSISDNFA